MKKLLFFLFALAAGCGSFSGFAQPIDRAGLDSLFDALEVHNLDMGSICITQDGKTVYRRTFGRTLAGTVSGDGTLAGRLGGEGTFAGAAPAYRIGSITKVFTGVMIYELIDQKRLSLDDTLSEFFPGLAHAGQITIAELLGHRSGLANFTATAAGYDNWKGQPHSHAQLLSYITLQQPDFAAGARADYNNSNFLLLGYILEQIYKRPYKALVTERIVNRLHLQHTYYGDHAGFQDGEAPSYKYSDNNWQEEKAVYLDNFGGAGAMISTPDDLCLFIKAIFDGRLISKASLGRMTRIEKDGYGWGMFPFGDSAHKGFGHNGKTEGFASSMQYYPAERLAIGYCTNGESYPKDAILDAVVKLCFREPVVVPDFVPVAVSAAALQPLVGTYVGDNGLKVVATVVNERLSLEVKEQQFVLDALSERRFHNVRFGFFFDFDAHGKGLVVHDAAMTYWLHRE
jgi:CubicO group peptidase (beta-lactamase class C family)